MKLLIPDCRPNPVDFILQQGSTIGHALLIDHDNAVYYTSGELLAIVSTRLARLRPEGGPISFNNQTVPADTQHAPFTLQMD